MQAAIAKIEGGGQSYTLEGNAYTRAELKILYEREERLRALAAREARGGRAPGTCHRTAARRLLVVVPQDGSELVLPQQGAAGREPGAVCPRGREVYVVSDVVIGRIVRGEQAATEPIDDAAHGHVLVAIFLLTGCRFRGVAGLELDDVSFDRKTITVRPNRWRGLKTRTSHRVIPMWPQLEAILRARIFDPRLERGVPAPPVVVVAR